MCVRSSRHCLYLTSDYQELALRDQLLAKQLKNDIALATACWKKNLISTQGFCVTDSEPRLAWMPGVLDDGVEEYVDLQKRRKEVRVALCTAVVCDTCLCCLLYR